MFGQYWVVWKIRWIVSLFDLVFGCCVDFLELLFAVSVWVFCSGLGVFVSGTCGGVDSWMRFWFRVLTA